MQQTLIAIVADLAPRVAAINAAVAASTDPELGFQRDLALTGCHAVQTRAPQLLASVATATPAQHGILLRRLQRLSTVLWFIENQILPVLERFAEADRRQTAILRRVLAEAGWADWFPPVLTWSTQYFSAASTPRVINVTAGEQNRILRIPDLCHEFGHCLFDHEEPKKLSKVLLPSLSLWASAAADADEAKRRDRINTLWRDKWLAEFTCDAVGTYLTGPAYGHQHLMLTALLKATPYKHSPTHPADHARAVGIARTLEQMGLDVDAAAFWHRWKELCEALRQPDPDPDFKAAAKPANFWDAYPADGNGYLIDQVAAVTVAGCTGLGIAPFDPAVDPSTTIRGLVADAWDRYWSDPFAYSNIEPQLVSRLHSLL